MYPDDENDPYGALMKQVEEMSEAVERMKQAEAAGKITQGRLKSVERTLEQVRTSLQASGPDGIEKVSSALDRIAAATAVQADVASRTEERASTRVKKPSTAVLRGVDFISQATGYERSRQRDSEPGAIYWIEPRQAQRRDTVSLYGTVDLSDVDEIRVDGLVAAIGYSTADRIDFTVPDKADDGSVEVDVDIGGKFSAWQTELDVL